MGNCPAAFFIAQAVGLSGAAWLSGNIAAYSLNVCPALFSSAQENNLAPSTVAKIWRNVYNLGYAQNPPVSMVTAAAFFYLSWATRSGTAMLHEKTGCTASLYSSAGILTLLIIPYTFTVMAGTNNGLIEQSKLVESEPVAKMMGANSETERLMRKWVVLNGVRGLIPLSGFVVGLYAALGRPFR
ncbi:hypothetical protein PABG_06200 [Paracoccidioides brasiliensis Pb03]|uniref:DUF1772 domain-containing protein n=2 Tax=Paracoccidioides brasiliensis TaxID=121759 RepID=C1GKH9_PARBD|nr:uncharacterized protein PADG_07765 [Paracoccidioides brasiliensis Pb18]EEH16113.1 hypothetical protein PABG_06200 [Paracoccidioides brasiliensis Pb03]EEH42945.1 hypothetical protein PADG_07765 [Paracoccidioides brasiliensis Pb18]ODH13088.1 hypothetical protein ACO22_07609 [Paracoccidioides brasiliensis]ODH53630.1 hypothetical protein GX48_00048 [Paracoccidioides brasiliensis]